MDNPEVITCVELCAGYGGIALGVQSVVPNLRVIATCEIEGYAVANLVVKSEAGKLDPAPNWSNVKTFPFADFYGCVDLLLAGFPCQPFSFAGNGLATEDPRHLFPHIAAGLTLMRPRRILLENVEGIITAKCRHQPGAEDGEPVLLYVLRELERRGYWPTWGIFSALEEKANQQRKRVFIYAELADAMHATGSPEHGQQHRERPEIARSAGGPELGHAPGDEQRRHADRAHGQRFADRGPGEQELADTRSRQLSQQGGGAQKREGLGSTGEDLAHGDGSRQPQSERHVEAQRDRVVDGGKDLADSERQPLGTEQQHEPGRREASSTQDESMSGGRSEEHMADTAGARREDGQDSGTSRRASRAARGRRSQPQRDGEPMADAIPVSGHPGTEPAGRQTGPDARRGGEGTELANPEHRRREGRRPQGRRTTAALSPGKKGDLENAEHEIAWERISGAQAGTGTDQLGRRGLAGSIEDLDQARDERLQRHPPGPDDDAAWRDVLAIDPSLEPARYFGLPDFEEILCDLGEQRLTAKRRERKAISRKMLLVAVAIRFGWEASQSPFRELVNVRPFRVDELRLAGNAVLPYTARTAWLVLTDKLARERNKCLPSPTTTA